MAKAKNKKTERLLFKYDVGNYLKGNIYDVPLDLVSWAKGAGALVHSGDISKPKEIDLPAPEPVATIALPEDEELAIDEELPKDDYFVEG